MAIISVAREAEHIARARFSELESTLGILSAQIEAYNPFDVMKRGYVKPSKELDTLKTGDEFELLYYPKDGKSLKKGVAEWKNLKK